MTDGGGEAARERREIEQADRERESKSKKRSREPPETVVAPHPPRAAVAPPQPPNEKEEEEEKKTDKKAVLVAHEKIFNVKERVGLLEHRVFKGSIYDERKLVERVEYLEGVVFKRIRWGQPLMQRVEYLEQKLNGPSTPKAEEQAEPEATEPEKSLPKVAAEA